MKLAMFLLAALAALHTSSAAATNLSKLEDLRVGSSRAELEAQLTHSTDVVEFFTVGPHRWMPAPAHRSCEAFSGPVRTAVCRRARAALRGHRWLADVARTRLRALYPAPSPGGWAEFACIHRLEGATDSNTGNGYYGGLQMDVPFQKTYGPRFYKDWGTADRWPVWAQVTAARRARDSGRGYSPWPRTARLCHQL